MLRLNLERRTSGRPPAGTNHMQPTPLLTALRIKWKDAVRANSPALRESPAMADARARRSPTTTELTDASHTDRAVHQHDPTGNPQPGPDL